MSQLDESDAEIIRHCYHEAGHAVVGVLGGFTIKLLVISTEISHTEFVTLAGAPVGYVLRMALAGGVAQEKFTGVPATAVHLSGDAQQIQWCERLLNDPKFASSIADDARAMVAKYWESVVGLAERLKSLPVVDGKRQFGGQEAMDLIIPILTRLK